MTEGEWTLNPQTEGELARSRRDRVRVRVLGTILVLTALGVCPYSCFSFAPYADPASWMAYAGIVSLTVLCFGFVRLATLEYDARTARIRALDAEHATIPGWFVDLTVYQGDAPTGTDRGVLWFEEDRLFFSGSRTSFGLLPGDGLRLERHRRIAGLRSSLTLRLFDIGHELPLAVGFEEIANDSASPLNAVDSEGLAKAIGTWVLKGGAGGGQGPPRTLGPGTPGSGLLLARSVESTLLILVPLALVLGGLFVAGGSPALVVLVAFAIALRFVPRSWGPLVRWRAWQDRRRLDRREPTKDRRGGTKNSS